jgi:hypothetical protein
LVDILWNVVFLVTVLVGWRGYLLDQIFFDKADGVKAATNDMAGRLVWKAMDGESMVDWKCELGTECAGLVEIQGA